MNRQAASKKAVLVLCTTTAKTKGEFMHSYVNGNIFHSDVYTTVAEQEKSPGACIGGYICAMQVGGFCSSDKCTCRFTERNCLDRIRGA